MGGLVSVFALVMTPSLAQHLGQNADDGISVWRVVAALIVCLGLAVAIPFALKYRLANKLVSGTFLQRGTRRLQIVENLRLAHQVNLCIVKCDGQQMLVSVTNQGVRIVTTLTPDASERP